MIITAATLSARWLAGWFLGARPRSLRSRNPERPPGVSVVIPARNEARMLPRLLASLERQTLAPREILVVDDDSDDDTAAIAREAGAIVVDAGPLPPHWTGKTWACARGAERATGELLVFLDADTCAAPDLVASLAAEHEARGGLVSVQPFHRMARPYERLSALFNLVSGMGIGSTSIRRTARITGAYGPCLAIGRAEYERIGGHTGVAGEVLEDVALARRASAADLPVAALAGGELVEFRMYPDGVRSLGRGWSKNFAAGAGTTPPARLIAIVAWVSGLLEAGWWTVAGLMTLPFGGAVSILHVAFYGLYAIQCAWMLRKVGNFGSTAWLHPIVAATFLLVFFHSLRATLRGEVRWKDRTVPTRLRVGS